MASKPSFTAVKNCFTGAKASPTEPLILFMLRWKVEANSLMDLLRFFGMPMRFCWKSSRFGFVSPSTCTAFSQRPPSLESRVEIAMPSAPRMPMPPLAAVRITALNPSKARLPTEYKVPSKPVLFSPFSRKVSMYCAIFVFFSMLPSASTGLRSLVSAVLMPPSFSRRVPLPVATS